MTTVQEHATLIRMDAQTETALQDAGAAYKQAPAALKAAIIAAGRTGEKPANIVRAIGHVYTYDYVAKLIRLDRAEQEKKRRAQS